jgi:hypothetical protein
LSPAGTGSLKSYFASQKNTLRIFLQASRFIMSFINSDLIQPSC